MFKTWIVTFRSALPNTGSQITVIGQAILQTASAIPPAAESLFSAASGAGIFKECSKNGVTAAGHETFVSPPLRDPDCQRNDVKLWLAIEPIVEPPSPEFVNDKAEFEKKMAVLRSLVEKSEGLGHRSEEINVRCDAIKERLASLSADYEHRFGPLPPFETPDK